MVAIPGASGGVLVGIDVGRGILGHYTKEGLLIGSMKSSPTFSDPAREPWVVGRLDAYLAVNCNRDPRDGLIDVFVEDNMNQRIVWYRVKDTNIRTVGEGAFNVNGSTGTGNVLTAINGTGNGKIGADSRSEAHILTVENGTGSGSYNPGTRIRVSANPAPAGQYFAAWTGDTAILSNPLFATTSALMPSIDVTITATYAAGTSGTGLHGQ